MKQVSCLIQVKIPKKWTLPIWVENSTQTSQGSRNSLKMEGIKRRETKKMGNKMGLKAERLTKIKVKICKPEAKAATKTLEKSRKKI